ncbi:MAG: hypothetical protein ACTSWN_07990 [Promethearchaeota archaeon]
MKKITKDLEFPVKSWKESIITSTGIGISIIICFCCLFNLSGRSLFQNLTCLVIGIIFGSIFSFFFVDKIKRKHLSISLSSILNFFIFLFLISNHFYEIPFYLVNLLFLILGFNFTLILINFSTILSLTTGILERGRVVGIIYSSMIFLIPILYFSLKYFELNYWLNFFNLLYSLDVFKKRIQNERFLIPEMKFKQIFSKKIAKYLTIVYGLGFIEGLLLPEDIFYITDYNFLLLFLFLPVILIIAFFSGGIIFDRYGRRRSIGLIIFLIGVYIFTRAIEDILKTYRISIGIYIAVIILSLIAIIVIIGDISISPAKMLPIFSLITVISILQGIFIHNLLLMQEQLSNLLFNIANLGILIIFVVLVNTADTLPQKEKNWDKSLIALYLMHHSGILIDHQNFRMNQAVSTNDDVLASKDGTDESRDDELQPDLVSSGLIGIIQLLQEILKGKKIVKSIDNYTKKIIIEKGKDIIAALITDQDLRILREKLKNFVRDFEDKYHSKLQAPKGFNLNEFIGLEELKNKYFEVKYFNVKEFYQ